ncbi:MAG: transcriptional regulator NrdR [Deltaproteobacteria bacterium]|nr:transcriptional regulator NrdR [Deltaproteobacteria bacterium]
MQCPFCADDGNRVIDSRLARDGSEIRRRRECDECGRRFTTRERVEEVLPRVIKRDERREEWDRNKLLRGVEHACVKRPVSAEAVARLIDRVERELQESGEREVTSDYVGRRTLEELSAIDVLAAVRFASVFLDFSSPSDYEAFFSELSARAAAIPGAADVSGTPGADQDQTDDRKVRPLSARR